MYNICFAEFNISRHSHIIKLCVSLSSLGLSSLGPKFGDIFCLKRCPTLLATITTTTISIFIITPTPPTSPPPHLWNAKLDFSCYIYLVGNIFICSCILFSGCVIFHLLVLIFICSCIIYVSFVQFLFVGVNFFLSLLVFSLSMLRIICLVPYFVRHAVFCSAC